MNVERRSSKRHKAMLKASLDVGSRTFDASITRDASETGLLLTTDADVQVGDPVVVRCELGPTLLSMTATVARREPSATAGLFELALSFTAKNPLVAEIFRQLEKRDSAPPSGPPSTTPPAPPK